MKKNSIILLIILAVNVLLATAPVVSNVIVSPQSGKLVITYDLAADAECKVIVLLSQNGGAKYNIYPNSLTGHVGDYVLPGIGKEIVWRPSADNIEIGTNYKIRIIARDNPLIPTNPLAAEEVDSFIKISGGTFNNGTADVTISDFYLCKYEVTQGEFQAVMGYLPSLNANIGIGNSYPIYYVTWYEAIKLCNVRSIQEGLTPCYSYDNQGSNPDEWSSSWNSTNQFNHTKYSFDTSANGYRLPTEMEWMYAARGGNQQTLATNNYWAGTDSSNDAGNYMWYTVNSNPRSTKEVGGKLPNQLGLYDMSGNVSEWCWDIYGSYSTSPQTNPLGTSIGNLRSARGGAFRDSGPQCKVDYRHNYPPYLFYSSYGFRLARNAE